MYTGDKNSSLANLGTIIIIIGLLQSSIWCVQIGYTKHDLKYYVKVIQKNNTFLQKCQTKSDSMEKGTGQKYGAGTLTDNAHFQNYVKYI